MAVTRNRSILALALASLLLQLAACASNPYGYAPEYAPLSEEEPYFEQGQALGYEDVRRDPMTYQPKLIGWFGVVTDVQQAEGGAVRVALDLRFHQQRHLCMDQFDESCRVTISDKTGGPFTAVLTLRPEDREGRDRVYAGSLLKVYGHVTTEYDDRGGPIVKTEYYRHWPRNTYVSSSHAVNMRR